MAKHKLAHKGRVDRKAKDGEQNVGGALLINNNDGMDSCFTEGQEDDGDSRWMLDG
jgi:hypothetical protein